MTDEGGRGGISGVLARFGLDGYLAFALEGVVAVILSLYMILAPDNARDNIRFVAGLLLMASGVYQLWRGLVFHRAGTHRTVTPVRFIGGAMMLFGGFVVVLEQLAGSGYVNADASRTVLALTLLAAGVFGIVAAVLGIKERDFKLANVAASVVLIVLAGFNVAEVRSGHDQTRTLGYIVLLLGLALLGWAYLVRQRELDQPIAVAAPAAARYVAPPPVQSFPNHEASGQPSAAAFEQATEPIEPDRSEAPKPTNPSA